MMNQNSLFENRVAILATMHQKEQVIAPLFLEELGIQIQVPEQFNTDIFGTFTREIKRQGNQIEAARLKAEKALEITGETLAIASEGSFNLHPLIPYAYSNLEIVLFLDQKNSLEIIGQELSLETNYHQKWVSSQEEALNCAQKIGFPEHGLIVRLNETTSADGEIFKGITNYPDLIEALSAIFKQSPDHRAFLETDMRAMYNPTRLKVIEKATLNLIQKIQSLCPQCSWPGFDVVQRLPGLPCGLCGFPTALIKAEIYACKKCGFAQEKVFPKGIKTADPGQCEYCNP